MNDPDTYEYTDPPEGARMPDGRIVGEDSGEPKPAGDSETWLADKRFNVRRLPAQ